jgi:hypothetical protein
MNHFEFFGISKIQIMQHYSCVLANYYLTNPKLAEYLSKGMLKGIAIPTREEFGLSIMAPASRTTS